MLWIHADVFICSGLDPTERAFMGFQLLYPKIFMRKSANMLLRHRHNCLIRGGHMSFGFRGHLSSVILLRISPANSRLSQKLDRLMIQTGLAGARPGSHGRRI